MSSVLGIARVRAGHVAGLLAALYFGVLWATASDVGFVRDEGYYFKAAEEYSNYFRVLLSSRFLDALGDAEIERHFSYNTEHPAFVKLLQGATFQVFHRWLGVASPSQGFRITGFVFAALSLLATYLLGRRLACPGVGLLASALLATTPRYFYDAHLACFDVPITAMWTFGLVSFHEALTCAPERARSRAILAGVVFGLALSTKLNAIFLPVIFVLLWFWSPNRGRFALKKGPSGGWDLELPLVPRVLFGCAILGPIVFVLLWPHLWHDTLQRIGGYVGFHLHHEHYPISYFHRLYAKPPFPWSFPFVMTALTAPSPIVLLGGLGFFVAAVRATRSRSLSDALLVLGAFVPMFLIALPTTPIFGGVKHWHNAMPCLVVLAARSAFWGKDALLALLRRVRPRMARAIVSPSLVAFMLIPGILGCLFSHPHGIAYYSEVAGGFRGGASLGLQRGFWGGLAFPTYGSLRDLSTGSRVFFNRTNYDAYRMYLREGLIPRHVFYANDAKGAEAAVHFEQPEHGEREGEIWSNLGTRPAGGVYADDVTLTQLYVRSKSGGLPPR